MIVLRFMSAYEAISLLQGMTYINATDHKAQGNKTTSVGACFVICDRLEDPGIYEAAQYLSGIAMMDACLVGELKPEHGLKKTKGWYRDGWKAEMSATKYSLKDFASWEIWTPELPPYQQMFKIISSANWLDPVKAARSEP